MEGMIIITESEYRRQTEKLLIYMMKEEKTNKKISQLIEDVKKLEEGNDDLRALLKQTQDKLEEAQKENKELNKGIICWYRKCKQLENESSAAGQDVGEVPLPEGYIDDGEPVPF